jgi:putative ubiquitin-RnfH superfamily antitoxin RatB of RatAB toxin-antitoxin module
MQVEETIAVSIVYALPDEQVMIELRVPSGTTAREAIERSGLLSRFPDACASKIGIYGRLVETDSRLDDGDRLEIYRNLTADAKLARRERAARRLR